MKKEITVREWNELWSTILDIRNMVKELKEVHLKELLTPAEVCIKLGISKRTYRRYVKNGIIKQIKQGDKENSPAVVEHSFVQALLEGKRAIND